MNILKEQRAELESRLKRKEDTHSDKYSKGVAVETAYQDSAKEIADIYKELSDVCDQLGDPIPVRW